MFLQNDPSFPEAIRRWGCYFFSILCQAEIKRGKAFPKEEILAIYKAAMQTGIIDRERVAKDGTLTDGCTVLDPVALFTLAGVRVHSVAKSDPVVPCPADGIEILVYRREANTPAGAQNASHTHFVAGDGSGGIRFDPLGKSLTVKYGSLQGKRIFV